MSTKQDGYRGRSGSWVLAPFLVLVFAALSRAELQCLQPTFDAGEVRAGAPLVHSFSLVNKGPGVVEITDVHTSCGCMAPRLEKRTLQPGEESSLLLEVNTLSQPNGFHNWRVQLTSQGGAGLQEMALQLTGQMITEITVQPAAMTVFADSAVGHDVLLTDLRPKPLAITDVRTSSPQLKAQEAGESADAQGHQVRTINLTVPADYPEGRHEEVLVIETDDPTYRELKVPVTVIKRSKQRLAAVPAQVALTAGPGQALPAQVLLIHDNEQEAVRVARAEADDPAVICTWAQGPGAMATVRIRVDGGRLTGKELQTVVHVHVTKPVPQDLTIPVRVSTP